jgi:hypothetical protein
MVPPEYLVVSAIITVVIRLVTFRYLVPEDIDNGFDEEGNFIPTEEFP